MGHGSDKLYVTYSEHSSGSHSASSSGAQRKQSNFAKLPFDCCALTLKPFELPCCTRDGNCYDLLAIMPYVARHKSDPVTGKPLAPKDLIRLNFARNNEGSYHDPVTYRVFSNYSHLVAIATSGNVYLKETVDRLNVTAQNWHDLVSEEPFKRSDIITIQDPSKIEARDLSQFSYIKNDVDIPKQATSLDAINMGAAGPNTAKILRDLSSTTASSTAQPSEASAQEPSLIDEELRAKGKPYNRSIVSNNRAAASLTSTSASLYTKTENALWNEEDLMYEDVRNKSAKAYAQLVTNMGKINLELFADRAPRTCYNFVQLAKQNKYHETIFHRLIPGFMVQGGDPTGTGRGGQSFWGQPFEDEHSVRNAYKHEERGMLSMANSGPNTNGSQFFITFRETKHLNGKHTVFGRIVGGEEVLSKIERVPVETGTDRPLKPIRLLDVLIFKDPFEEYKVALRKRLQREADERDQVPRQVQEKSHDRKTWFGEKLGDEKDTQAVGQGGVGRYLRAQPGKRAVDDKGAGGNVPAAKKSKFGDFSSW